MQSFDYKKAQVIISSLQRTLFHVMKAQSPLLTCPRVHPDFVIRSLKLLDVSIPWHLNIIEPFPMVVVSSNVNSSIECLLAIPFLFLAFAFRAY